MLVLMASCISEPELTDVIKVGDQLPNFTITMNDGSTLRTSDLAGSESMIVFFTTMCEDCRRELPRINDYADTHREIRVVCISRNEGAESVEKFWKQENLILPYSAQSDAKIYNMFAHSIVPRIYVADADLTVTAVYVEEFQ